MGHQPVEHVVTVAKPQEGVAEEDRVRGLEGLVGVHDHREPAVDLKAVEGDGGGDDPADDAAVVVALDQEVRGRGGLCSRADDERAVPVGPSGDGAVQAAVAEGGGPQLPTQTPKPPKKRPAPKLSDEEKEARRRALLAAFQRPFPSAEEILKAVKVQKAEQTQGYNEGG